MVCFKNHYHSIGTDFDAPAPIGRRASAAAESANDVGGTYRGIWCTMIEVGERTSYSRQRGGGGRWRAQFRSPHRRGRTRTGAMAFRTLFALAALVALAATSTSETSQPRLIDFDPWAWLPASRNRSPSIMDYFFPPSRTPKQSNLDPPHDREPPRTTVSRPTVGGETLPPTTVETRTASPARKATTTLTKNKSTNTIRSSTNTVTATASGGLKTKKLPQKISASPDTTIDYEITKNAKTEISTDSTTVSVRTSNESSTPRPTKHYTIHPVRTTERTTLTDVETTYDTESTEIVDDPTEDGATGTTSAEFKETSPALNTATVAESRATSDATGASTQPVDSSTEPADSREGYLPLRDRPAQTHVKINDQTKKEGRLVAISSLKITIISIQTARVREKEHLNSMAEAVTLSIISREKAGCITSDNVQTKKERN
ncbi:hypothetical protein EVAR_62166_1 [Eumeta japonica]|uniref:AP2/ERF domain-containing protein n=1 Tax=Eumeta variegata TaxID=151549 RepID=A0A4C1ZNF8_EUMVA|nr:hypothetical protein EVAR_62166_1 [Eumeta japonica]